MRNMNRSKPSTVGRGKSLNKVFQKSQKKKWQDDYVHLYLGDSLDHYNKWDTPITIISDGGYGILGFEGDTPDHQKLPSWYEPHIKEWAAHHLLIGFDNIIIFPRIKSAPCHF